MYFKLSDPGFCKTTLISLFLYSCSVDDGFPTVTFHFDGSLSLTVYAHEYLFQLGMGNVSLQILVRLLAC